MRDRYAGTCIGGPRSGQFFVRDRPVWRIPIEPLMTVADGWAEAMTMTADSVVKLGEYRWVERRKMLPRKLADGTYDWMDVSEWRWHEPD